MTQMMRVPGYRRRADQARRKSICPTFMGYNTRVLLSTPPDASPAGCVENQLFGKHASGVLCDMLCSYSVTCDAQGGSGLGFSVRGARCATEAVCSWGALTTHGARCATHGARCATHAARCATHGARCATHGARCATHGERCATHGVRCATHGARCATEAVCSCSMARNKEWQTSLRTGALHLCTAVGVTQGQCCKEPASSLPSAISWRALSQHGPIYGHKQAC